MRVLYRSNRLGTCNGKGSGLIHTGPPKWMIRRCEGNSRLPLNRITVLTPCQMLDSLDTWRYVSVDLLGPRRWCTGKPENLQSICRFHRQPVFCSTDADVVCVPGQSACSSDQIGCTAFYWFTGIHSTPGVMLNPERLPTARLSRVS